MGQEGSAEAQNKGDRSCIRTVVWTVLEEKGGKDGKGMERRKPGRLTKELSIHPKALEHHAKCELLDSLILL